MIKEYEQFVQSRKNKDYATISSRLNDERTADILHAVLGVASEAYELMQAIDEANKLEECGDILFFATMGLEAIGKPLSTLTEDTLQTRHLPGVTDPLDALKAILFRGKLVDDYLESFEVLFTNSIVLIKKEYPLSLIIESNQVKLNARHKVQQNYEQESANRNVKEERTIMTKFLTTAQGDNA